MKRRIIIISCLLCFSSLSAFSQNILTLSIRGGVFLTDVQRTTTSVMCPSFPFNGEIAAAIFVDTSTSRSIVAKTVSAGVFAFNLGEPRSPWIRLASLGRDSMGLAYDRRRSAILTTAPGSTDTTKLILRTSANTAKINMPQLEDIRFSKTIESFRGILSGGSLSQEEAAAQMAKPLFLSDNPWNLAGASESFLTYLQFPTTVGGLDRRNSVLIIDKSSHYRSMKIMPRVSTANTYDNVVIIQEMNYQKSSDVEQQTRNVWIYSKSYENFVSGELEDGALILSADASYIYYSIKKDLRRVRYDATGCGKPENLATIPEAPIFALVKQ